MANANVLFHWTSNVDPELPKWVTREMLTGKYTSTTGHHVAMPNAGTTGVIYGSRSGKVTNGFMKALLRAAMIANGCDADGYGSNKNSGMGIAEYTLSGVYEGDKVGRGEIVCAVYNRKDGEFRANKSGTAYNGANTTSAPLFLAMWDYFCEDTLFDASFSEFCNATDDDIKRSCACLMADIAYYNTKAGTGSLPVMDSAVVSNLTATRIGAPTLKPTQYLGNFQYFKAGKRVIKGKKGKTGDGRAMATADFIGAYKFRDASDPLTDDEKKLIPQLDEKYIVGDTLVLLCDHILKTTGRSRPVRNILLRGEPGNGKSEMYVGIAAACGEPLYRFAANAMTEPYDLFGQFVPVDENGKQTGGKVPVDQILSGLPSAVDISMDPVLAYQQITGLYKADATSVECMSAMFNLAQKSLDVGDGQQKFKFVPGQLIYAMRHGGVWGFDEVTLPQNPGVVPALNPAMDGTQSITLPTGEIVHRHPCCIFVGTTNIDLEGCRRMNQSWQDRCQLILDIKEPDDDELEARIKSMTDFDDAKDSKLINMSKFIRAYHEMKEITKKRRLTDGQIGPRKLADWVTSTLVTGDALLSAEITIIPGATADPKGIAELREKLSDLF